MAGVPFRMYPATKSASADCKVSCSSTIRSWEMIGRRSSGRCSACEQKRKQNPRWRWEECLRQGLACSRTSQFAVYSGKHGDDITRTKYLRFESRSQSFRFKVRRVNLMYPFSDLVEPLSRRAVDRRKGVRRLRLYAAFDPYETLGVESTATDKEIKQAFRRLALKFHPDVSKEPDAEQRFMRIKNAYQALADEKSRAKYDASKQGSSSAWNTFRWDSGRSSPKKPQDEEFYGFGEFFKDITISIEDFFRDLQADSRKQATKPKSLWEELADIGEEFVEFLEKELNINDMSSNEERSFSYKEKGGSLDTEERSDDPGQNSPRDQQADKAQVETEIAEIEDMLAKLKKELGI